MDSPPIILIDFPLLAHQKEALIGLFAEGTRGLFLNGGTASGKSITGVYAMAEAVGRGAKTLAFLAPTYQQLERILLKYAGRDGTPVEFGPNYPLWRGLMPGRWNQSKALYECDSGAIIYLYTAERGAVERFASIHPEFTWADEFGAYSDTAISIVLERLGTKRGARLLCTSTPYHARGRYFDLVSAPPPGFRVVEAVSAANTFAFTPDEIAAQRSIMPEHEFRLKYCGEFVLPEGLIFEVPDAQRIDMIPDNWFPEVYYGGIDWGYTHAAAFILVGVDGQGKAIVLREIYMKKSTVDELVSAIKSLVLMVPGLRVGDIRCFADPSQPASILSAQRWGLRVQPAENKVDAGLSRVQMLVRRGMRFVKPFCVNLLHECDRWTYKPGTDTPETTGDDACDALRYACMGMPADLGAAVLNVSKHLGATRYLNPAKGYGMP